MKPYALSEIREMCLMAGAVKQNSLVGAHSKFVRQWGLSFWGHDIGRQLNLWSLNEMNFGIGFD